MKRDNEFAERLSLVEGDALFEQQLLCRRVDLDGHIEIRDIAEGAMRTQDDCRGLAGMTAKQKLEKPEAAKPTHMRVGLQERQASSK